MTVTFNGKSYSCSKAIKGSNYIHLLDTNGNIIAAFDGISNFSGFTLGSGESWTNAATVSDSNVAVLSEGGIVKASNVKSGDLVSVVSTADVTQVEGPFAANRLIVTDETGTPVASEIDVTTASFINKVELTKEEFDAIEIKDPNTLYVVTDENDANSGVQILEEMDPIIVPIDATTLEGHTADYFASVEYVQETLADFDFGDIDEKYVSNDQLGVVGGVATLDESGKVPSEQLPEMNYAALGEDGKVGYSQLPDFFFVGSYKPSNEKVIWIDTTENLLKYCVNGEWIAIGAVFG